MFTKSIPHLLCGALLLLTSACSDSASSTPMDTSVGDPNTLVGTFQVSLVAPDSATGVAGYTAVIGKVTDGATPSQLIWTESQRAGLCVLSKPSVPFCNTPCGGSAVCAAENTCKAYPSAKSVGTVSVSGVKTTAGATSFSMDPVSGNYQPPAGVSLPYPAFSEGAAISVSAAGGVYAPFSLQTVGISPLQITSQNLQVATGQDLRVTWSSPTQSVGSKIYIKLDISHHGGTKGMIECTSDDTGSLTIASSLVTELVNLGTAGFPSIIVTRKAPVGSALIAPGRVDLVVQSSLEQYVTVPGVTSCNSNADCLGGTTCQSDLTCK